MPGDLQKHLLAEPAKYPNSNKTTTNKKSLTDFNIFTKKR
jgi:hypothetical protein